jgi:hypothetical protein
MTSRPLPPALVDASCMSAEQLLHKLASHTEAVEAVAYPKGLVNATADKDWCAAWRA